jgi:host factor-I protein
MHGVLLRARPAVRPQERTDPNRKLIRVSLAEVQNQPPVVDPIAEEAQEVAQTADATRAESYYYQKQMKARTAMTVVLNSGEVLSGVIEWYDKRCIKLNRIGRPNLLIMKSAIRYMQKANDSPATSDSSED